MIKVGEIAKSWWTSMNPTEKQSILAKKRLAICEECPSMIESVVFTYKCKECGCPIDKKIFTNVVGACPLQKLNKIDGV